MRRQILDFSVTSAELRASAVNSYIRLCSARVGKIQRRKMHRRDAENAEKR